MNLRRPQKVCARGGLWFTLLAAMPLTYQVEREKRLVLVRLSGYLRTAEVFDYQRTVWSLPEVAGFDELVDMSGVTEVEAVGRDIMVELAALASSMDPVGTAARTAIVAAKPEHFGLARMYEAHRETTPGATRKIRVFGEMDEAVAWLAHSPQEKASNQSTT